jgi:2-C-methyl-D-erythritol 4-phosphate cytidylyltransferase
VIIPAGGAGTRLGRRTPKQFLRLGRAPILAVTVAHFARHPRVGVIVVAVPSAHVTRAERLLRRSGGRAPVRVVAGGATRQESVARALAAVPPGLDPVIVHDAVRPLITRAVIDRVLAATDRDGAAICALPVAETVKRVRDGRVETTIDRRDLWSVQTPQAFRTALLREAHDKARRDGIDGTDDAMLVERLGHSVRVVEGLAANIKITTLADLARARAAR